MDCDEDEDEDDELIMQDEVCNFSDRGSAHAHYWMFVSQLFRRIIANTAHKQNHSYRLSYSYDVGSSFDPDMEDVNRWESELQGQFLVF
jgi:hypothetical protein